MQKNKKRGFTLIELMIVLAIIAILAVVLVPKASLLKTQTRNQGVLTNLNVVRGYIETRVERDKFTMANGGDRNAIRADVVNYMAGSYTGSNTLNNPLTNGTQIYNAGDNTGYNGSVAYQNCSVIVFSWNGNSTDANYQTSFPWIGANMKGNVVVVACNDGGYIVYGVDNGGSQVGYAIVH